jgi:hypothetical protein
MTSQKLLLVLIMNVFKNEETTNVVNNCVLIERVVVDCALVLSIVSN